MARVTPRDAPSGRGIVYDIQRYTLNDGPGIRTMVFLKGCFMRCRWCANPESQAAAIQLTHSRSLCRQCHDCIAACRFGALSSADDFVITVDPARCTMCLDCVSVCPAGALRVVGKEMTVSQVVDEACRDRVFYRKSSGGVTISGGEPLYQYDFLRSLLHTLHAAYIHTAVETTGSLAWSLFQALLPDLDLILYDLKTTDNDLHRTYTGMDNTRVLENLRHLDRSGTPVWLRLPIIPGHTDDEKNLSRVGELAASLSCIKKICLLPYHRLGINKYLSLGMTYQLGDLAPPSEEHLRIIESRLRRQAPNIEVQISG